MGDRQPGGAGLVEGEQSGIRTPICFGGAFLSPIVHLPRAPAARPIAYGAGEKRHASRLYNVAVTDPLKSAAIRVP